VATKASPERPNVILYLVDTLRADRVGARRTAGSLTPRLDAFAQEATVFENAIAQAPWTKPSVTSIFTGLGPLVHGVRRIHDKLPPEAVTLAELLHAAGYQTAGFSTNWHVSHDTGLDQGFVFFDFAPDASASDLLNQRVFRWLDGHGQSRSPFFLYVHALDPHGPYTPPEEFRARFATGVRSDAGTGPELQRIYRTKGKVRHRLITEVAPLYDAEVAFNDHSFGAFLDALRRQGLYDSSLILFVSDHGEEFDEHGEFGHGNNLYNETLRVPLIVKWPHQRQGRTIQALAQHVDLLPTLLRAAGLQTPKNLPGLDLAQVAASGEDPDALTGRAVLSHMNREGREGISVLQANWKLIQPLTREMADTPKLYHLPTDPEERTNRLGNLPIRAGWLESLIRLEQARSRNGLKTQTYEMDEETRRGLEALGYL
jgi:arylsulfatase A-like enzyme